MLDSLISAAESHVCNSYALKRYLINNSTNISVVFHTCFVSRKRVTKFNNE